MQYVLLIRRLVTILVLIPLKVFSQIPSASFLSNPDTLKSEQNISATAVDSTLLKTKADRLSLYLKNIDLPYDSVTAITIENDGRVWIGSRNGLWVCDDKISIEYSYKEGLFNKNIRQIFYSSEGRVWVATSSGPFALIDNHFYVFEPLKNKKILSISENSDNWLFLSEDGIHIFKKDRSIFESLSFIEIFI